jgi:NAD(P)H-dependent FMN reductase
MINGGMTDPTALAEELPDAAILAFSGSSRHGSFNRRLLDIAVGEALALGAETSILDLRDLDLPVYDPDLTADEVPQGVLVLRQIVSAHDGFLIATPEYNGSLPPILKNALDWSTRAILRGKATTPYRGKVGSIMSASIGMTGGLGCLSHLRSVLARLGVLVLPDELSLRSAGSAFDESTLRDPAIQELLRQQVATLVGTLRLCRQHGYGH